MKKQFGLKEFLSSFLIGFIVSFFVFQPYLYMARADIGSSIGGMVNESVNYAPPTFKQMGERGYVGFGSLSIRDPVGNLNIKPFSFTPPFVKKGCGAIDIAMGGFNFLGFDYLVQKLQQILQAAPAFAFQLALEVFVPQVSQVLSKINAIADMINNINFDACKATTNIVHAIAPTVRDMIFNSRTDEAGQEQSNGQTDFWKGLSNNNIIPSWDEIKSKFSDLINSLTSYISDNGKSNTNPISLLKNQGSFTVFKDRVALNNPEYAPRNTYLQFVQSDDYDLKTAFIGDLTVKEATDSNGNVIDVTPSFDASDYSNMEKFMTEVDTCVSANQDSIRSAVKSALEVMDVSSIDQLAVNCNVEMPVGDHSSNISFDVGNTIVKPILKSLVSYYISISQEKSLDSTSAKWVNFIGSIDSSIVRAIKVAALAGGQGGSSDVVTFLGDIVSGNLVEMVTAYYVSRLVTEGCSELESAVTTLSTELGQVVTANSDKDPKSANSSSILDAVRNKVTSEKTYIMQVCSSKSSYAGNIVRVVENNINGQQRQGLIELAKNLEKTLVENLNSRGLGTLAKYVHVE